MTGRILILGAAGRLGRAAAEAFRDNGWSVASQVRGSALARAAPGTETIEVDALDRKSVIEAAHGADVILHALNPPYTAWPKLAAPLTETAIAAAHAARATLLFPGNVYNYGPDVPAVIDETTPMQPTSRKGKLRVAVEERLRAATGNGMRTVILRAGDFYGSAGTGSWFDRIVIKDLARDRLTFPGPLDVMHAWAYLPDLAAAMVRLAAARDRLGGFETFGFPGHTVTGREFVRAIVKATGRNLSVGTMPWWIIQALSPVVPIFRELAEMAYLWVVPHRIDGDRLKASIGDLPATPFDQAIAAALRELGAIR